MREVFDMAVYQLSANNFLGVDKNNNYLYVLKIKLPKFVDIKENFIGEHGYNYINYEDPESLDIKFHEGKFTRFKLWIDFPKIDQQAQKSFSINLMFHPELMQIQKYAFHDDERFYVDTKPQKSDVSLDELEENFEHFHLINLFFNSQFERVGVRNQ